MVDAAAHADGTFSAARSGCSSAECLRQRPLSDRSAGAPDWRSPCAPGRRVSWPAQRSGNAPSASGRRDGGGQAPSGRRRRAGRRRTTWCGRRGTHPPGRAGNEIRSRPSTVIGWFPASPPRYQYRDITTHFQSFSKMTSKNSLLTPLMFFICSSTPPWRRPRVSGSVEAVPNAAARNRSFGTDRTVITMINGTS